jgi:hypothetical protein
MTKFDIEQSDLLKFVFDETTQPVIIACLQLISSLCVESINLLMITGQRSMIAVIANFVKVKVISDIDNIYSGSIKDHTIATIKSSEWKPKIVYTKVKWDDRSPGNRCLFLIQRILKLIFNSFYFYFFPFLTLVLNYNSKSCSEIMIMDSIRSAAAQKPQYAPLCTPQTWQNILNQFQTPLFDL